ncbi:hypothetical protein CERSUDRAFT_116659 [Gelatoporia subvermispora B]|uniref:Myb-like domain-containing protein n=1 Tax=Ceriporiopsis subvermispora (strain B) TaxID=914234 RepID=M2R8X5_CERS8|nr:hypothetical protein CERSUDRAFT_116659 [Gelatoporia subvermispora B]
MTTMANVPAPEMSSCLPSTSTFSFTAPFPTSSTPASSSSLKQRRVSLALPSSPRLFPAWSFRDDTGVGVHSSADSATGVPEKKGKMRKIAASSDHTDDDPPFQMEKKQRKKWTQEETQMLVAGCNKWGVGNWKSILNDPEFKFDNRSPVDLKDRFRTYWPDAYKQYYPNAKTHLSSKVRASLPDGTSIFEKTRSKKRRPFTEEEDRALKAGYDKHGTVWATIVKDPIFQEQNRRSTDLRDRFRNAFPDLYQAAGYKPRTNTKKKKAQTPQPIRAATDDQLASSSSTSGTAQRKRRHTDQGLLRGGTKSVPGSATCSEDEDSSDGEDEPPASTTSTHPEPSIIAMPSEDTSTTVSDTFASEYDMQTMDALSEPLSIPDFIPSSSLSEMTDSSQSQAWSTALDTPLHPASWTNAANVASPTSSHISSNDYFISQSPFNRRDGNAGVMIGKSAWGPQDWLSANPRLEPSNSGASSSSPSFIGGGGLSPAPSSPFSFADLSHGVLDRYDLFPSSFSLAHDFSSDAGLSEYDRDTHSAFSDPHLTAPSGFRGFTHHSNYAGDLIFGARTHQPQHPMSLDGSAGFGFGFGGAGAGLGLSGVHQQSQQPGAGAGLHLRTPALPGIDEIALTSITLDDQTEGQTPDLDRMEESLDTAMPKDDGAPLGLGGFDAFTLPSQTLDELVGLTHDMGVSPPGTPVISAETRSFRDVVHSHAGIAYGPGAVHNRSVSVPPSEHRPMLPRATQSQLLKSKPLADPERPFTLDDILHFNATGPDAVPIAGPSQLQPQAQSQQLPLFASYASDNAKTPGDNYDLPFLDLHYYTAYGGNFAASGSGTVSGDASVDFAKANMDMARQGQALDLAQSIATSMKPFGLPPSLTQHIPGPPISHSLGGTPSMGVRGMPLHHRGQSAVSPQDLLLRKGNENKRKRSSWDGGAR